MDIDLSDKCRKNLDDIKKFLKLKSDNKTIQYLIENFEKQRE